jgi:hypothetical protein
VEAAAGWEKKRHKEGHGNDMRWQAVHLEEPRKKDIEKPAHERSSDQDTKEVQAEGKKQKARPGSTELHGRRRAHAKETSRSSRQGNRMSASQELLERNAGTGAAQRDTAKKRTEAARGLDEIREHVERGRFLQAPAMRDAARGQLSWMCCSGSGDGY